LSRRPQQQEGVSVGLDNDRVVLVTGASRGAGKGIALALAPGATVYVTGRTTTGVASDLPGTIEATAEEVTARGGTGVAVACDHDDDRQVEALFRRIADERGHLDVLVNNAIALPPELPGPRPFWEMPLEDELRVLGVGLRSHYVAGWHAARLMARQGNGLVVFTSSPGARTHLPGVHTPPYGAGKAGSDKMAFDMACELRPYGVAVLSIWMGLLVTERVLATMAAADAAGAAPIDGTLFPGMETPEFVGRVIDRLARDPRLLERSGGTFYSSELGEEYGVTDLDGSTPPSYRAWLGPPSEFPDVAPTYADFLARQGADARQGAEAR
jgi:NAD(P)-dependent dehydrogenase (short-subunit alcohol dehydrogenase family)